MKKLQQRTVIDKSNENQIDCPLPSQATFATQYFIDFSAL